MVVGKVPQSTADQHAVPLKLKCPKQVNISMKIRQTPNRFLNSSAKKNPGLTPLKKYISCLSEFGTV